MSTRPAIVAFLLVFGAASVAQADPPRPQLKAKRTITKKTTGKQMATTSKKRQLTKRRTNRVTQVTCPILFKPQLGVLEGTGHTVVAEHNKARFNKRFTKTYGVRCRFHGKIRTTYTPGPNQSCERLTGNAFLVTNKSALKAPKGYRVVSDLIKITKSPTQNGTTAVCSLELDVYIKLVRK